MNRSGVTERKTLEGFLFWGRKPHTTSPCPTEFRERAVQMVVDHLDSYRSRTAVLRDIARKLGYSPDSLRVWYKQARRDAGEEAGQTSAGKLRIKELERENREVRQADEILKKASAYFAHAELYRLFCK